MSSLDVLRVFVILLVILAVTSGHPQRERCAAAADDCVWDKDTEFPTYPSLLMDKETWMSILPTLNGDIREVRIAAGATVVIACPESSILATGSDVTEGVCEGGSVLNVGGTNYNMMELGCESRLKETLLKNQGSCGPSNSGEMTIIGYNVTGYDFYDLVDVCFEPVNEIALYTYHLLRGESQSASDVNPSRPSFKSDSGYYTVSANTCYETSSQETLMGDILGDSSVIDYSSSLYFARGHLSPDADFMTEMEMDATYYYINAVPQWQVFNNGNWKYTEMAVRDLAESHGTDFEIWTGPWNILELDDVDSNPVEIFLGLTEDENVIPAPDVTWKVIYEPSSDRGVAIIGVNNPYVESFPDPLCSDICDQVSWIDFDVTDLSKGATYCCTVQDLHDAVPTAPDLGSAGLLSD